MENCAYLRKKPGYAPGCSGNLYLMVSTKVKDGSVLLFLGQNVNTLKAKAKKKQNQGKTKIPVSVWSSQKCSFLEISCHIKFNVVACFG